ncbi:hypothetical protein GGR51DRAFT_21300 [Nemania sp. FL0031]|nr:hypothetical protein GGR51DRAFT_21300 [Nemania sp. FL0031]
MSGDTTELYKRYDNSNEKPNPLNYKSTVEGIVIPFAVISWICVILRIHTRYRLQCLGWDDLFVVLFRAVGTVGTAFVFVLFDYGLGKHFWAIGEANQVQFQKKYYIVLLAYVVSTALMKLCLLAQYIRLFHDDGRARKVCWFFIVLSALWGVAFAAIALVPCVPLSGFWNWNASSHCYGFGSRIPNQIGATYATHVATNVVLDLIVLAIPIPLFFKTFKQRKQRVGFSAILLLGIGINVISIWRLHIIIMTRAATYPVIDPTFYGPQSIVLAALEVDLASIVASVPVFWPMLTHGWGAIFVTQEVHVTRHHRRLSGVAGHDQFELRRASDFSPSRKSTRTRDTNSDGSIKLVIMETEGGPDPHSHSHSRDSSRAGSLNMLPIEGGRERDRSKGYDRNDPYVRGRIYPLDGAGIVASEAQVVSEGQRGFERNYREHFGVSPAHDKADEGRISVEQRVSKDENGDRSWSLSISRKSSQRF